MHKYVILEVHTGMYGLMISYEGQNMSLWTNGALHSICKVFLYMEMYKGQSQLVSWTTGHYSKTIPCQKNRTKKYLILSITDLSLSER